MFTLWLTGGIWVLFVFVNFHEFKLLMALEEERRTEIKPDLQRLPPRRIQQAVVFHKHSNLGMPLKAHSNNLSLLSWMCYCRSGPPVLESTSQVLRRCRYMRTRTPGSINIYMNWQQGHMHTHIYNQQSNTHLIFFLCGLESLFSIWICTLILLCVWIFSSSDDSFEMFWLCF